MSVPLYQLAEDACTHPDVPIIRQAALGGSRIAPAKYFRRSLSQFISNLVNIVLVPSHVCRRYHNFGLLNGKLAEVST